jgi:anti-repressor protein
MNELVYIENDRVLTDSLIVSEAFSKDHARVMRDIRELGCSAEFRVGNFAESTYTNKQGRPTPKILITQDGLTLLAMGYTGQTAMQFKEKYIQEFNRMKNELNRLVVPSYMIDDPVSRAQKWIEEQKQLQLAQQTIKKQQPLVSFAESCMASDKSLLVRELAKLVSKQGILIGERRLYQKLRDWRLIFLAKNEPYQEYIDRGYFEVSQGVKENEKGSFTWLTMRVTPKGQAYIINRLKKEQQDVAI